MRWSASFIPTLRDDPADAEAPSHKLLVRAGFMRQLMAGVYSLLPLGFRVSRKITDIVRQEMDRIGGQEFCLPTLHPGEILVCEATDPSYASYFLVAEGVITDIGGAMGHGAIVAREVGIPCVVNTRDATRRLQTGDRVRIDGTTGAVERLDPSGGTSAKSSGGPT